jgi:hypothetical protein
MCGTSEESCSPATISAQKKYFDPYPLHLVLKKSPISFMSDVEWLKLVEH